MVCLASWQPATKQAGPMQLFCFADTESNPDDSVGIRPDCSSVPEFLSLRTGDSWATHPLWFVPSFLHRKPLYHR